MKTSEKIRIISVVLENLPHAFNFRYWDMADTTYKEEVFLSLLISMKIEKTEALKIQSKVLPKNKLIRNILNEKVVECMGCYGEYNGLSFFNNEIKFY